ncbi:FadR family transcriptional regulator [Mesobaculum littorinae]|uniref:FadR family transcriptional regulator n=1 Tax=Mesobaculum littorinae TaxID=2486419 RepID=A0A438AFS0_9RHOB|nr:FadR/GntR family transcriptional regulator [Mesobaculum littorinae]RVV97546.1 FadR family transcriptional regulator [Mesobaculum littorinae]
MPDRATPPQTSPARTRVAMIADSLRRDIEAGRYKPGDRLPSERELTEAHSVSRTVVREALGLLRSDGLVEARKGSGVFALEPSGAAHPFGDIDVERLSGVIELFELRSAFEIRAAGLAAARRSGEQIDTIQRANDGVLAEIDAQRSPREADFAFHLAIAEATNNRRFPEFLNLIRPGIVPRVELEAHDGTPRPYRPNPKLVVEHAAIADAIVDGDRDAAEAAMEAHLEDSLGRYRQLWRDGARRG